jgi:hypothetical protein
MHISHGRSGQPSEQRTATFTEWGGEVGESDYTAAQP